MADLKRVVLRTGMEALYFSGAYHFLRPLLGGVGAILTLHHVRPPRPDAFQPNRLLEVTPDFLDDVLRDLRHAPARSSSRSTRCIGGWSSATSTAASSASPSTTAIATICVMRCRSSKKYEVPFALYIPTSFPDRLGELWWLALEARDRAERPASGS